MQADRLLIFETYPIIDRPAMPKAKAVKNVIMAAGGIDAVAALIGCSHYTVITWIQANRFPSTPRIVERAVREEAERRQAAGAGARA